MTTQAYSFGQTAIPNGDTPIPPTSLPASISSLHASLNRHTTVDPTSWPNPATTLSIELQVSFDGGSTWAPGGGLTSAGGTYLKKDGVTEQAVTTLDVEYAQSPTHVKGTITVTNGPLVTSGGSISVN